VRTRDFIRALGAGSGRIRRIGAMQVIRMATPLVLVSALLLLSACGTVHLDAPPGRAIAVLDEKAETSVRIEKVVWFKWWGSEPLSDAKASTIIEENGLREARLTMVNTLVDGTLGSITGIFGFPRLTLVVEGNR
jgi:hypothetical protein